MDPLFDSVTAVGTDIERKLFFLFCLFFYPLQREASFSLQHVFRPIRMDHTNCLQVAIKTLQFNAPFNHAFALCLTPIVLFDRMFGCSQFLFVAKGYRFDHPSVSPVQGSLSSCFWGID